MAEGEPIRLLIVGLKWPPETFLARLLGGLSRRGLAITIAGSTRPRDAAFHRSGFGWLRVPSEKWPRRIRRVRAAIAGAARSSLGVGRSEGVGAIETALDDRFTRLAARVGRRWDLIYFPWNSAAIAGLPLFDLGIPVAVSCRGSQLKISPHNPERAVIGDGLEETFRRAALVHCVSQDILDEARAYGLDPDRAHVIRPAIDPAFFSPGSVEVQAEAGPLRIITTGSLIWTKGHESALSALRVLRDRGIPARLAIIGEGPERQRILYTVRDLGLDGSVELLGRLAPDQVRDRLRAADAFLLSSLSEGISNAALEAMACGLPIVTTDCGGMREAVDDGVEGFVVPVREPGAMADALARLAGDPELRQRMGRAARQRVEREFHLDRHIDQWVELCERTVSEWRERR